MKWISRKWWLAAAISLLCLGGCSAEESIEPDEQPVLTDTYPFTGETGGETVDGRPILATISNIPAARPQSGLADADIVYEFLAEGQITRFAALFQSKIPGQIGPIRSARDYFVRLAEGMDAFYISHGYSPDAKKLLDERVVDHINGINHDGTLFERSASRRAPHNSYISKEHIEEAFTLRNASEKITARPSFSFLNPAESDKIGDIASTVQVAYSRDPDFISTYQYNPEANRYYRSVNGIDTVDTLNEKRIELANIIVMEMDHQTVDQQGRLAIDLESGGRAMLFHEGIAKTIEWQNRDGFLMPMEQGVPVKLTTGKTWIHIVPSLSNPSASITYTP